MAPYLYIQLHHPTCNNMLRGFSFLVEKKDVFSYIFVALRFEVLAIWICFSCLSKTFHLYLCLILLF